MGGLIALHAILTGQIRPRCLVLSSPLLGLPRVPFPPALAYRLSEAFTALGLGHVHSGGGRHSKPPFAFNLLTHSPEKFQIIQHSPYPLRSPTFQWVKASFEATKLIHNPEYLKRLNIPVLVLCGTSERVVDKSVVQPWVELARQHSGAQIDMQWVQGGRHELLFESKPYYDRAIATISEWFSKIGLPV